MHHEYRHDPCDQQVDDDQPQRGGHERHAREDLEKTRALGAADHQLDQPQHDEGGQDRQRISGRIEHQERRSGAHRLSAGELIAQPRRHDGDAKTEHQSRGKGRGDSAKHSPPPRLRAAGLEQNGDRDQRRGDHGDERSGDGQRVDWRQPKLRLNVLSHIARRRYVENGIAGVGLAGRIEKRDIVAEHLLKEERQRHGRGRQNRDCAEHDRASPGASAFPHQNKSRRRPNRRASEIPHEIRA